jgi:hypothetical protein
MKIRYELTIDDMVVFYRYHSTHSPLYQHVITKWAVLGIATILLFVGVLALLIRENEILALCTLAVGIIAAGVFAFRVPAYFRARIEQTTRKAYSSEKNEKALGLRELELTDTVLISRGSFDEGSVKLESIKNVVTVEGYAFVYTSSSTAFVVPRHRVTRGDYQEFVQAVRQIVAKRPAS